MAYSETGFNWQLHRTMTPTGLRNARKALGMSQAACGRYLGVSPSTIRRYQRGEIEIPTPVALLLHALLALGLAPEVPPWRKP